MIVSPFSRSVAADSIGFAQYLSSDQLVLTEEEARYPTPTSSLQRKREFAIGRRAAREALALVGASSAEMLQTDSGGNPLWPEGFLGSIAHKNDCAVAVASTADRIWALGVDLEKVNPRCFGILERIAIASEKEWVLSDKADSQRRAVMLFSVKESIYKALYPRCRRFIRFHDVEVGPPQPVATDGAIDPNLPRAECLSVKLLFDLNPTLRKDFTFEAYVHSDELDVTTGVAIQAEPVR